MGAFTVYMKWNESKNRWDCSLRPDSLFIMDFPDCANMRRLWKGLDKRRQTKFSVTLELLAVCRKKKKEEQQ
jgi:hypothetical protein